MSRLNDLLRQLRTNEPDLARDLEREVAALADRRAFGLNFERHVPEAVELPGRKVRKGDKARVLPPRGATPKKAGERLWRVVSIDWGTSAASLAALDGDDTGVAPLDDLVVVAEFRDPIYPGLVSTGRVDRGGDKPFHSVINAENFHALETLLFTHRGQVDCIYIDPPYNTGAKDWKYNNDYVEGDDLYRHSKWLAMMERRLLLAQELLNPEDSVLIVTIDEKEYLRLGLLLEQMFAEANIQMVSIAVNPATVSRTGEFGRADEYAYFVMFGSARPQKVELPADWITTRGRTHRGEIRWDLLRRSGTSGAARRDRPGLFYPVFIDILSGRLHSVGEPIPSDEKRSNLSAPTGTVAVWPIRQDGSEGRWMIGPKALRELAPQGYVKVGRVSGEATPIYYLKPGEVEKIQSGQYLAVGNEADGSVRTAQGDVGARSLPSTQWRLAAHDSTQYGARLLRLLLPDRVFPFPKSLYAVEDCLRFFVADKPSAVVVDFFAGSGTTAHAVMRLNKQDGGRRQAIVVTNNEVAADEQRALREKGLRTGDPEWEQWGICEYITKPRIEAAITGRTPTGEPIKGDYKFTNEFPMADGFEENVEFFTLTYEAPLRVTSNREFAKVAPLLWIRAGSRGRRIDDITAGWDVADTYGILADLDHTEDFLKTVAANEDARVAYIVTDEDRLFESVAQELPDHVEPVRLYEAYLRNFEIESGARCTLKFTLKDYQADAVDDVLANLKRARENYKHSDKHEISSFSLTATTGAGKTVMAAAAIEALFWGGEAFDFDPDPGAVVLWFSDDPSLNEQTRNRLMQSSEKFTYTNLVRIEPPFAKPRLDPGKVYFLNTQKLTKSSLLTRGHVEAEGHQQLTGWAEIAPPDMQGWTIWETLANTIDADDLTLYLVLDEAHRGFNSKATSDKPTTVRRLVNGTKARPPIPIVWGISATIQHFETAMKEAEATKNRRALPPVIVDPVRVQESGLVKDALVLDIPDEAGNFDSVLVRHAARKLRESTERWAEYTTAQGLFETVEPLLVIQTPNTPDPDEVGIAIDTIFAEYPDLRASSVRHVLGDHSTQKFGAWEVEWIEPQRVQDESQVRVLVAKDAISTGWDCPRAEVLVSFRRARDTTHITQLLGRMVRSPLARRVPGDERLNAVDCILPFFDRTTAVQVVRYLTGDLEDIPGSAKKAVIDGKELLPNPNVPDAVWDLWETLPTETIPQRGARPVKRLVALAQALSADAVRPGALKEVEEELHRVLDSYAMRYEKQLEAAIQEVWDVHIKEIEGRFGKTGLTYSEFVERADDRAIRTGFETAKKAFGADIAQSYVNHLAGPDNPEADDGVLREAFVRAAALATVKEVREKVDLDALELTNKLFAEHRVAVKGLPDVRQQEYEDIRAMATDPQLGTLREPRTRIEGFSVEKDDQIAAAPLAPLHLMSDEDGQFPLTSLNKWEQEVVLAELARTNVRGWYRNPSRAAVDSLGIAYREDGGNWRSMHPDFVFFHEVRGGIVASIVDPHGHHLDDAATKLKALARFAADFGDAFHRIEAIAEVDGRMRVIDMQLPTSREAVLAGKQPPIDLYRSDIASTYEHTAR